MFAKVIEYTCYINLATSIELCLIIKFRKFPRQRKSDNRGSSHWAFLRKLQKCTNNFAYMFDIHICKNQIK